jgi:hypothetical protein
VKIKHAVKYHNRVVSNRCWSCWKTYTSNRKAKWKRDVELSAHYRHMRLKTGWRHWRQGVRAAYTRRIYFVGIMIRGDQCCKRRYWLGWLEYCRQNQKRMHLNAVAFAFSEKSLKCAVFRAWAKQVGCTRQSVLRQSAAVHHWAGNLLGRTWKRWRLLVVLHQAHDRKLENADLWCRRMRQTRALKVRMVVRELSCENSRENSRVRARSENSRVRVVSSVSVHGNDCPSWLLRTGVSST